MRILALVILALSVFQLFVACVSPKSVATTKSFVHAHVTIIMLSVALAVVS